MYILPVFIAMGVLGSALGTVVLLGTFLRFKFFTHFLVCLNVCSAAFLLTVFMSWLADTGVDVFGAPGLCQVHVFSSHFFPFLAVWSSVLGSYLVLWDWVRPREVLWLHSPTAAKTAVLSLSVLGFTVYSYKTWTHISLSHRGSRVCTVIPENEPAMEILNVLDVLVLLVLPSALFLLFVAIVFFRRMRPYCRREAWRRCCCCCLAKGRDRVIYTSPSGDVIAEVEAGASSAAAAVPRFREVHRLVLSQALCFLLLVSPRAVSTLVVIAHRWLYNQRQALDDILLHHVFQFAFYLYFALLPFCPAFSSGKFRLHCCSLLAARKNRAAAATPVAETPTTQAE